MDLSCSYGVSSDLLTAQPSVAGRISAAVVLYNTKRMTVPQESYCRTFTSEGRIYKYFRFTSQETKDRQIHPFTANWTCSHIYRKIDLGQVIMKFVYILLAALPMSLACKCVPTKCYDLPALPVCFLTHTIFFLSLSLSSETTSKIIGLRHYHFSSTRNANVRTQLGLNEAYFATSRPRSRSVLPTHQNKHLSHRS